MCHPAACEGATHAGLLCLARAEKGGLSAWSSSTTVHNEILKRAPHLARVLAARGAWYFDRKGEIPEASNGQPFFELPVFNYHQVGVIGTSVMESGTGGAHGDLESGVEVHRLNCTSRDRLQLQHSVRSLSCWSRSAGAVLAQSFKLDTML